MTREQTHKALYVVAIFAFLSLLTSLITAKEIYFYIRGSFPLIFGVCLFVLYRLLLLIAAFSKNNKILFLVPIDAYFNLVGHATDVFQYYVTNTIIIPYTGILPGAYIALIITLMDTAGLIVLGLRLYGYWQEHRAGKETKF